MKKLSPTFADEVLASALAGKPFSWTEEGVIRGRGNLTAEENALLDQLIAAHNSNYAPVKSWSRVLDLKMEFTPQERASMRGFAKTDATAEDFLDLLTSASRISANDPLLLQGLQYFVSKKVLTQARVDQILKV